MKIYKTIRDILLWLFMALVSLYIYYDNRRQEQVYQLFWLFHQSLSRLEDSLTKTLRPGLDKGQKL